MTELDNCIASKRRTARIYSERLADVPGITPPRQAEWAFSTFWLYTVLVDEAQYGMGSRTLLRRLRETDIQSHPLWHPIHTACRRTATARLTASKSPTGCMPRP